ncbi:MAG TPA: redoxin domain-containing protein [Patescibacteria group bacterium]|nr:redoxin domain-containing protein [Patescibacteria group bacterium]
MTPGKPRNLATYIFIGLIVIMGIEIIYLVVQNRILKNIIADPTKYFRTLSKNEVVPSFSAQDIEGNDVEVNYAPDEPYTMLFWFGSTCSSCEDNIGYWKRLYGEYRSERLRFLGIFIGNPGSARRYVSARQIEFPVLCATHRYLVDVYRGHVLPQTMLVTPQGVVDGIWPGILRENEETAIIELIENLQDRW